MRACRGELSKLASLPSVWVSCLVGVAVPAVVAFISASTGDTKAGADAGFQELAFGVVGAVVLGVVAASSEYSTEGEASGGGRQITTSLTVVPSRTRFLLAKVAAVITTATVLAVAAAAITLTFVQVLLGDHVQASDVSRVPGVVVYWVLTALLAFGITLLTRNGIVPLAVLILNTSVVTVTFLLTKITTLAVYFPDMAGLRMFIIEMDLPVHLSPVAGGAVMAAWVVVLLAAGVAVFRRRDA
ncbi:ABC transporter permease [Lentzea californiensis]|uniref:ABC transporter permease n=1 Tax=Lentzea californiensis TaxID=438851 RepID=UPI002166891E|nr:ABC transporter permease [Lentzea californiensis]MCR3753779.1 ABC-2 family transporter protein [Lentzea californiensis]